MFVLLHTTKKVWNSSQLESCYIGLMGVLLKLKLKVSNINKCLATEKMFVCSDNCFHFSGHFFILQQIFHTVDSLTVTNCNTATRANI